MERVDVKVGQVWADNDKRHKGRTIKVIEIVDGQYARCTVLTGRSPEVNNGFVSKPIPETKIRLDRFRPTSTGFKLLTETLPS